MKKNRMLSTLSLLALAAAVVVIAYATKDYPSWVAFAIILPYVFLRALGEPILLVAGWFFAPAWAMSIFSACFLIPIAIGYIQAKRDNPAQAALDTPGLEEMLDAESLATLKIIAKNGGIDPRDLFDLEQPDR